uniref:Ribosomal protein L19 n=1 Tax=Tsukubamonas globosa TaxID=875863 RepID=W8VKJ4_9EUKA|nr:ribosomal protein L19 [Tsukubamonas globosa]BAO51981.1 ribosomal protein L19 [Tsukubamonas globosa]
MLEKNLMQTLNTVAIINKNINTQHYKHIKKGDKIEIRIQTGKNKQQTIEGICTCIKKNTHNPAITIKYKLSGIVIEQRIPLGLQEILSVTKIQQVKKNK